MMCVQILIFPRKRLNTVNNLLVTRIEIAMGLGERNMERFAERYPEKRSRKPEIRL